MHTSVKPFCKNEVYYGLTYADVDMRYPQVTTFIFLGKNLFEDEPDTWYFQFMDQKKTRRVLSEDPSSERRVRCLKNEELHEMLDLHELHTELTKAANRRSSDKDGESGSDA